MCTLTKDINYLCPSKPLIQDNTGGICGLKPMTKDTQSPATATPRYQVVATQVGNGWLLTPTKSVTLTYDRHDTPTRIELPDQIL